MTKVETDATDAAVQRLRDKAEGSDPWTQSGGTGGRTGGFAWRDAAGNEFDVTISMTRRAPRTSAEHAKARLESAWRTVMLGDDAAFSTDPAGWRYAVRCRDRSMN